MKRTILSIFTALTTLLLSAQTPVMLHFNHQLGSHAFEPDSPAEVDGYQFKVDRLEYYVSEISIHHDGGQITEAGHLWLLVNPVEDNGDYDLGVFDVENIEGITFHVGVDSAHNHLDPTAYPAGHALAPQNPSMHWGWAAGYRFIAFEGVAGSNFAYDFQIHSIGDELYKTVSLETGADQQGDGLVITVNADYYGLLKDIDASGGVISHGGIGEAKQIMDNIETEVFSAEAVSSVADPAFSGSFMVSPNPAQGSSATAHFDLPAGFHYNLKLTDLAGRILSTQPLKEGQMTTGLKTPGAGMYLVQLWQDGKPVAVEKWVVVK